MSLTINHQTNDISATSGSLKVNNAFTLPTAAGTNEYVLQTNGDGTTSWIDHNNSILKKAQAMRLVFGG